MQPKKLLFLGSKPIGYNCLLYLINNKEKLNIEITGILTRQRLEFGTDNNLQELAVNNGIPVFENLNDLPECDILYSVQYHEILKQKDIDKAKQIAVNLHMAPLPEYRGSNQFSFAIIDKKEEFGTTIHKINTKIDNGDILFQKRFPIPDNCWVNKLYDLTYNASLNLFKQTIGHIVDCKYTPVSQELLVHKYGTSLHLRSEMEELKKIDLNWDIEKIERYIRATYMPGFEPPFCFINGRKIHFMLDKDTL